MAKKPAKKLDDNTLIDNDIELLGEIVKATNASSFMYIDPRNSVALVNNGLVETNDSKRTERGIATRATQKGIDYIMANASKTVETASAMPAHNFTIAAFDMSAVVKKEGKRRGRVAKYPIDELETGKYFFIPADEKTPDPVKSLAGTVTAANKRYAVATNETKIVKRKARGSDEVIEKTVAVTKAERKFAVYAYSQNGVNGAAVVRIA